MKSLSGLQRLWVVLSLLMAIPASVSSIAAWPQRDNNIADALSTGHCSEKIPTQKQLDVLEELQRRRRLGLLDPNQIARVDELARPWELCRDLRDFESLHQVSLVSIAGYDRYLRNARLRAIGWGAFAWVVAVFVLYALGWSVDWVIRGFRLSKGSQ